MKIGSKVSLIDEALEGHITSIHGNNVVFIDNHGFTHTVSKENVIVREDSLYNNIQIVEKTEVAQPKSVKHSKNQLTLDLHFENLVKTANQYNSFERLFIQKQKLLQTLDFCRDNSIKKLEIVHGIGDGTLQKMVHNVLESQTNLEFHNNAVLHQQSGSVTVFFK